MGLEIGILIVLLAFSALFSSAETAFLTLGRVQLQHQVQQGAPGADRVASLLETPRRLLSAILVGNNLVNTGAAAVATVIAADLVSEGAGVLAATLLVTVALVIFGEVGPKTIALHHPFALARAYAPALAVWSRLTTPVVAVLDAISRSLLRLIGEHGETGRGVSVGELRTAIRLGAETGAIDSAESSMLLGTLRLQEIQVREVMTARVNMVAAEAEASLDAIASQLAEAGFQRLPVYAGSTDNVVGYVHLSDIVRAYADGRREVSAREIMREVTFESERASLARLMTEMQESGRHLVMLIDEHGATSGLVTLEDLTEAIVGRIQSESGPRTDDVDVWIGGRLYVEGQRSLGDLGAQLGVDLRQGEAETVAGLILADLRAIPQRGESIEYAGYRFTVMASDERRVSLVAVERLTDTAGADGPDGPDGPAVAGDE